MPFHITYIQVSNGKYLIKQIIVPLSTASRYQLAINIAYIDAGQMEVGAWRKVLFTRREPFFGSTRVT